MMVSQFTVLLEGALRALIAALAVWTGLRLLRIRNVPAQKAAWGLVLIAALAMPLLMHWRWAPAWASVNLPNAPWTKVAVPAQFYSPAPAASTSLPGGQEAPTQSLPEKEAPFPSPAAPRDELYQPAITEREAAPIPAPVAAKTAAQSSAMSSTGRLLAAAWILYLLVFAALLMRLLWGLASSIRLWNDARPVESLSGFEATDSIAVRWSSRIASPVNIGSGILLPADYGEWGEEKLRVVVAHERSHIEQRDFYWQALAGLYASLTWFSPLGWWLRRKLSELSEAISDRAGLDAAASPSAYAQLLLEFAALPRPTVTGVPMAHSTNLSHRIERLLNESSFRSAFAGSRRALLTLLVTAALIVATAMVRVEAAQSPQSAAAASPSAQPIHQTPAAPDAQSSYTGQSNATQVTVPPSDQAPAVSQPAPGPASAAPSANPAPEAAPAPHMPPATAGESGNFAFYFPPVPPIDVQVEIPPMPPVMAYMKGFEGHASCFANGDAYAIVGDPGTKTRFCGNTGGEMEAEVEKARSSAHGHFLLFRHEGKYYVVDDPAIVSQIEDMNKALEDQGDQMRELGKQFREEGKQVREQARKERETANIPAPDLSKEMADLNATVASLAAKQGATVSREQLAQVQRAVSDIQRRVIDAEINAEMNIDTSKFNAEAGKFSEQMSRMGADMGRTASENHDKIESIIDGSLKNGKAKPVN